MHPLYMCSIHLARVTDPSPGIWSDPDLVSREREKIKSGVGVIIRVHLLHKVGYGLLDCGIHFFTRIGSGQANSVLKFFKNLPCSQAITEMRISESGGNKRRMRMCSIHSE